MPIRFRTIAPLALAFLAAVPAAAAAPASTCTTTPGQLRAASTTADISAQKKAMMLISTGERLCQVDAREEAAKKFAAAARALNVDLAALPTETASQ